MSNSLRCPITTDVEQAADILRSGGLVAFATETVYGLGANALNETAVARIFEAKNRPHFDPLIVHVADESWLPRLVREISPTARQLAGAFWPGPLTMVLPKTDLVPDLVTSGLPSVAVRMPSHPQARELLRLVDLPIAAPSANPFGQLSPTSAEHVAETLGSKIDLILDGGPATVGVESTVVLVLESGVQILRHGGLTQEQIESVIGPVTQQTQQRSHSDSAAAPSPGMLPQHYAPRTRLILSTDLAAFDLRGQRVGALMLTPTPRVLAFETVEVLTHDGNLTMAAAGFFAALRRLDHQQLDAIVAFPFPERGLGRALNDRLRRAAHE